MRLLKSLIVTLVIALAIPMSARAAEWSVEPKVTLRTGYNDNFRLTTSTHDPVWETALSPSVKFGVARENQGLFGNAGFSVRRFTGGSGKESGTALNRENYDLNTEAYHNTLRDSFKANLDYRQDSTLDSQLDQTGNVIEDRATRERIKLGPSWTRKLTEVSRLKFSYQYTNVGYSEDPGTADLVGFDLHDVSASLVHQLTSRIQGTLAAGLSSFQPDSDNDSDTLSLQVGLSRNFSETLVVSFLAGQRRTTSDSFIDTGFCTGGGIGASWPSCLPNGTPSPPITINNEIVTSAAVYTARIKKTLETGSLSARLSRSTSPSSNGTLLDSTRLVLSGKHRLSETLSSSLKIEFNENETIVSQAGIVPSQDTETFFRITPGIAWNWQRAWTLAGEYQYASNDNVNTPKATRNSVYVILSYQPPKRSISR